MVEAADGVVPFSVTDFALRSFHLRAVVPHARDNTCYGLTRGPKPTQILPLLFSSTFRRVGSNHAF